MDETVESSDPKPGPATTPDKRIGKYELLRALGTGGMGIVWAARDPDLDREVAIKVLRAAQASMEQRTRLLREARAMARLKHPNVLTVYEVASDGDRDFIAMELVDGTNLDVWLGQKPAERDVWDALLAAGRGLAAAHAAGLVHRDFKPHNVLRSRDGRVLVTDFGLARGRDDADALASTADSSAADSVLDLKLTSTGQMLGTPAYMAPEQFAGTAPDPRTDQFAFCVAAWEALSGERPFRGASIDALRTETERGVKEPARAPGAAKLSRAVRAVLVRGLAPQNSDRWPDMSALLRALARARRAPLRTMAIAGPIVAIAIIGGALAMHRDHATAPVAAPCAPGDQVLASAWSPSARTDLLAGHTDASDATATADAAKAFDEHATRWLAGYQQACTRSPAQRAKAVECYLGVRDELAVQVEIVERFGAGALGELAPWGVLAGRDVCAGDAPVASLRLPDDARRARAISLLAKAYGTIVSAPRNVLDAQGALRDEAKQLAWPALAPRVEEAIAIAAFQTGDYALAHKTYRSAAELARTAGDAPEEARARVGVLATARYDIADDMPATAYPDELRDAELAVKSAGNDPAIRGVLDANRAAYAAFGEYDLSHAIDPGEHAYAQLRDAHDVLSSLQLAQDLTQFLVLRSASGDLDRVVAIAEEVARAADRDPFRNIITEGWLRGVRAWAAWFKGDIDGMHVALDRPGYPVRPGGTPRSGHVVDDTGKPVAGALVVAWTGDLFGDAGRVYSDPTASPFDLATTDAHGAYTVSAHDGGALMAELGHLRSAPVPVRNGAQLALHATTTVSGTADLGGDVATGIEPYVRIDVTPTTAWFDSTPPAADGHYTVGGVPAAASFRIGAQGTSWPRDIGRRIDAGKATTIHWPVDMSLDYTVNAKAGTAWIVRGRVAPKTRAEVERLVRAAPDAATAAVRPIGWGTQTFAGVRTYGVNKHHFVFLDNLPGLVTICVAAAGEDSVRCQTERIDGDPQPARRDGRRWPGSQAGDFDFKR